MIEHDAGAVQRKYQGVMATLYVIGESPRQVFVETINGAPEALVGARNAAYALWIGYHELTPIGDVVVDPTAKMFQLLTEANNRIYEGAQACPVGHLRPFSIKPKMCQSKNKVMWLSRMAGRQYSCGLNHHNYTFFDLDPFTPVQERTLLGRWAHMGAAMDHPQMEINPDMKVNNKTIVFHNMINVLGTKVGEIMDDGAPWIPNPVIAKLLSEDLKKWKTRI